MLFWIRFKNIRRLLWVSLLVLLFAHNSAKASNGVPSGISSNSYDLQKVMWWLPEDTEMVYVVNKTFELASEQRNPDVGNTNFATMLAQLITCDFTKERSEMLRIDPTSVDKVDMAIHAGRKFRAPSKLGLGPFEGCTIYVFAPEDKSGPEKLLSMARKHSDKILRIAGAEVLMSKSLQEDDVWLQYLTIPAPGILISATDQKYLTTLLERIGHRQKKRALPDMLPEWKLIDKNSQIWALRHYDFANARQNPTSPYYVSSINGQENYQDLGAKGFVFQYDDGNKIAELKFLSTDAQAQKIRTKLWQELDKQASLGLAKVTSTTTGLLTIQIKASQCKSLNYFGLMLMMNLGHGIAM